MEIKYCKECGKEITHDKKRRLCTECLKKEAREASKYYYEKKFPKQEKEKTEFCKCGNKIEHSYKRLICTECLREESRQHYDFKKELYNKTRREKRNLNKVLDTRFCVICKTEFKTSHGIKCTCSNQCSKIHKGKLSLDNYYSKKVSNSNNK